MIYSVRHVTGFRYDPAVRESVMETRLQPRADMNQRLLNFRLEVDPPANIMQYQDFMGNIVHHFDIAGSHEEVTLTSIAVVEVLAPPQPRVEDSGTWEDLDEMIASEDHWEMLMPSHFAKPTDRLSELAAKLKLQRTGNILQMLMDLNEAIYNEFAYTPNSTKVDSPIDEALESSRGVCQDFAHIMIALLRSIRVPTRYVSGYLGNHDNKDRSPDGASHAWVEALIPNIGWVAFDPTNNLVGGVRHIRIALGRDYSDVPPTRGVYKGEARSELSVSVTVSPSEKPPKQNHPAIIVTRGGSTVIRANNRKAQDQQQQQQQQQQQ